MLWSPSPSITHDKFLDLDGNEFALIVAATRLDRRCRIGFEEIMAGYSGTPLAKKLGINAGCRIFVENAPHDYQSMLEPIPEGATILRRLKGKVNLIHLFTKEKCELAAQLADYRHRIVADGIIWVSWPKKAAKVPTDVTEDVIREIALPLGLVDTKVCAVDEIWSGLKLVIRLENRNP